MADVKQIYQCTITWLYNIHICSSFNFSIKYFNWCNSYLSISDNRYKWFLLYTMEGIVIEENIYTCPSCEQCFHEKEMSIHYNLDLVQEKFYIMRCLKKLNLTETERALVAAITVLSTGKNKAIHYYYTTMHNYLTMVNLKNTKSLYKHGTF